MKLTFIGVGAASASSKLWQSNMVLEIGGARLLIDMGGDVRHALAEQGLSFADIEAGYISHQHGDHCYGAEGFALHTKFNPKYVDDKGAKKKPKLFIHRSMRHSLWNNVLKAGLSTLQNQENTLGTYFQVVACRDNGGFKWRGTAFRLVQTVHYYNDCVQMPSYGLYWNTPLGKRVFLTGDTQFAPHTIQSFYDSADWIFHDCETSPYPSGIHAHYSKLVTLDARTKQKMWLYHYSDGELPDCQADGFAGFVKKGQVFDFGTES